MSESPDDDQFEDPTTQDVNEETAEEESSTNAQEDSADLGEDVGLDELGLDLESLRLPGLSQNNILGRPKIKPSLTSTADAKRPVGRPPKEDEGIFAWCEQFNYTPGVEFLKLHRAFPKIWEGMNIVGFIEEVYEPIDEHWLADRWGGGSYVLEAYQRDPSGRSRKVSTKGIEISGIPKAFMGSDGLPHPLPSNQSRYSTNSSRRSGDVLRRRMGLGGFRNGSQSDDDSDFEESVPPSRPVTANVDKPLVDASTLYKTLQETKKSENEALGVLREAQKDVHEQMQRTAQQQNEMYRSLLDQQKEEMRRLREESKSAAESSSAPFKELLQFMSAQNNVGGNVQSRENLEALRAAHDVAIQSLSREHSSHLDDLRKTYETRQTQLVDELNRLRNQFTHDIERIRADYIEKEKSAKDDAFRAYQTQLEIVRNQGVELRERQRDELATVAREKNDTINQLKMELNEIRSATMKREQESKMSLFERENTIKSEFMDRENKLRAEFLDRESRLQKQIDKLEQGQRTLILEERQRIKEEFEDRFNAKAEHLKETYESKFLTMQQTSQIRIDTAERESRLQIETMREKLESAVHSVNTVTKQELEAVKKEAKAEVLLAKERADVEVSLAKERAETAVANAQNDAKQQIEHIRATLEARIDSMKLEFAARETLSLEKTKLERENAQREKENQKLILENTAQSKEVLNEVSRKQLEIKVKELEKESLLLRTKNDELAFQNEELVATIQAPESNDPFEQLEKLNALKSKLKAHGFISEEDALKDLKDDDKDDEKEEKPKTLIDKLLHYGPQIVGPILQRVDAATAVAQQAMEQQQQQQVQQQQLQLQLQQQEALRTREELVAQQRRLEQEQSLAVQREQELRARREMLMQKRVEREQVLAQEAAVKQQAMLKRQQEILNRPRPQVLQQAQASAQDDSRPEASEATVLEDFVSTEQDVLTNVNNTYNLDNESLGAQLSEGDTTMSEQDPESTDGYKKLAEYLNTAIKDKKSAARVSGELQMALTMGMFSRQTLNEVLSQEFDTLVDILSAHESSLKSPKARIILKSVMDSLKK